MIAVNRFCRDTNRAEVPSPTRVQRVMELPLDYIPNPAFEAARTIAARRELASVPTPSARVKRPRLPADTPAYLASLYDVPLLGREQEQALFRRMNFLKYQAARLRDRLNPRRPKTELLDRIERLYEQAVAVKNQIIQANLRLVVSIAKRFASREHPLFELVSDGNLTLMRAVEKFDFARGFRFSTYATWALSRALARGLPARRKYRERFSSLDRYHLDGVVDDRAEPGPSESEQIRQAARMRQMLDHLNDRERYIIVSRFGLDGGTAPVTCRELGAELGVSKERVRQIELRALEKLRVACTSA